MTDDRTFVVIGGGLAGAKTAEALRERGFEGRVILFAGEPHLPYERPPLSKDYLKTGEKLEDVFVHDDAWYAAHDIEVRTGTTVTGIDRDAGQVVTDDGERTAYDRLVLATGSAPRRLSLPGAELGGVHTLRTIEDSQAIRAELVAGRRVVVHRRRLDRPRGGVRRPRGWRRGDRAGVAGPAAGAGARPARSRRCSPTCTASTASTCAPVSVVEAIEGSDGAISGVRLAGGEVVPADTVIVGIGAAPNVELAQAAGLAVDNGITADAVGRIERRRHLRGG